MLVAAVVVPSYEPQLVAYWRAEGLGQSSGILLKGMIWALARTGLIFLAVAAVFLIARHIARTALASRFLSVALLAMLSLDLGYVNKHYINVWDEYTRFTPRELVARLDPDKANYRVTLPARGGIYELWKTRIFSRHWINVFDAADMMSLLSEDKEFVEQLMRDPLRLWQLTSTRNILGPAAALAPLTNSPAVEVESHFNVMNDGSVQWTSAREGQQVWLRVRNVLPRAAVYQAWEVVGTNEWERRLADPTWDPERSVIVSGEVARSEVKPEERIPAEIYSYRPNRVEVKARSAARGILMLNDRYDPGWEVFVDGKPAVLLRCNGVMRGVEFPAGEHKVVFLYRPQLAYVVLNATAASVLAVWLVIRLAVGWRRRMKTRPVTGG
jgi:hypothetical protein